MDRTEFRTRLDLIDVLLKEHCSYVWAGPHELVKNPQLAGSVNWSQTDAGVVYRGLIKKARARRRRTFRTCRYCGGMFGPEHKHSPDVCDGCAEVHLGIIH